MVLVQIWAERYGAEIFGEKLPNIPKYVFVYKNGLVTAFRNGSELSKAVNLILKDKIGKNSKFIDQFVQSKAGAFKNMLNIQSKKNITYADLVDYFDGIFDYWQVHYISQFLPLDEANFDNLTRKKGLLLRAKIDKKVHAIWESIPKLMKKIWPELKGYVNNISWDEVKTNKIPKLKELKTRQKGEIVIYNGKIVDKATFKKLAAKYNFVLSTDEVSGKGAQVVGQVAFAGIIKGRVRKVMKISDMALMRKGEVLVSYMTMPAFMPALKKAAAFVTDEGGITCHAAIVARELKKPCVIGTKIATQVFKDGDRVEVDAEKGIVRKIG